MTGWREPSEESGYLPRALFKVESADIADSSQSVRLYIVKQEQCLAETHKANLFSTSVNNMEKVTVSPGLQVHKWVQYNCPCLKIDKAKV
jgi:hypothetical protein